MLVEVNGQFPFAVVNLNYIVRYRIRHGSVFLVPPFVLIGIFVNEEYFCT